MNLPRPPRRRQRGFTLIIVFLLVVLMVGVAAVVMLSSQTDLRIAGQDREATIAFYAAESGVAYAKDWLNSQAPQPGPTAWTNLFSLNPRCGLASCICTGFGLNTPGITPAPVNKVFLDVNIPSSFNFCIHNNALDPNFATGNLGNTTDADGIIAVEAYGYGPNGQVSHITVEYGATGAVALHAGGYTFSGDLHGVGEGGIQTGGAGVGFTRGL